MKAFLSSVSKESGCNEGQLGSISGCKRYAGEGNGNPFHDYCLENPMNREAWWATVHGVASCCCCCQVASVMPDSVRPHRWQPTRLLHPWDLPGKNIGVGCHFLLQCMHACMLSHFSCVRLFVTPWTSAHQAPLSTGFSRVGHNLVTKDHPLSSVINEKK